MDQPRPEGVSRRRFLQAGAAAGLVALPAGLRADKSTGEASRKETRNDGLGGFMLGVQSYSFRQFDTEQALKRTQDLGLHYIEVFQKHLPANSTPAQVQALKRLCHSYGITPVAYGVQAFTSNHDANKRLFDFGKELGIKGFSASPTPDSFDSLDKLVEEYKIEIAIHPHGPVGPPSLGKRRPMDRWYSAEIIMNAVKNHNPLIGSCLDTGHLIRAAELGKKLDPAEQIRVMGPRNFGIHLKDNDNSRDENVVFGKGVLDVPAVLKALKDVKFKGWISIEYEAHEDNPSPDMRACIDVFKEAVRHLA
jgi:sugar phosphate isomerase/epimerase